MSNFGTTGVGGIIYRMIASLRGTITTIAAHHLVIDVHGVGYRVSATPLTLAGVKIGAEAALIIYTAVREDALDLYGFLHENERRMFELLLSVSGIGPKSALSILSLADTTTLVNAVSAGKASYLTGISGIGKKTADKVVLELKDKVAELGIVGEYAEGDEATLEALRGMGYSQREAREALKRVPDDTEGEGARLRSALRSLGGK